MKKIILVDGNNLLFRSYYATAYTGNLMKNSKGFPTNGLYGFVNMMNKIINEENPEYIIVAFDKGKTFRHDKYEEYKAGRMETPDDLKVQFPVAKELLTKMGIKYYEIDEYEADDIIGTFAEYCNKESEFIGTIISSDRDLLQLISEDVEIKLLKQKGYIRYNKELFFEEFGIKPIQVVDLKAIEGDASDNIPGVKGIGPKGALKLLRDYETLDGIYDNIDKIGGKTGEKLIKDKDNAYLSYELATIVRDVPMSIDINDIIYNGANEEELRKMYEELEFYSLIKKMDSNEELEVRDVTIVNNPKELKLEAEYSIYIETLGSNYHRAPILGLALTDSKNSYFISFDVLKKDPSFLMEGKKYTYDAKKLINALRWNDITVNNIAMDTMIASYLLDYNTKEDIAYLSNQLGYDISFYENVYGKSKLKEPELEVIASEAVAKSEFIYKTRKQFIEELEKEELVNLYYDIELPLTFVLADMEYEGVHIDKGTLVNMGDEIKGKIENISNSIYEDAGEEFNISSPSQLGNILFEKLGLPHGKKGKTGYSTAIDVLNKIKDQHQIVEKVIEYRMLTKLHSTYIEGLLSAILDDGKIHTIYVQTLARTGRLSSIEPNLQNIPIRYDYGKLIRKAFVPSEKSVILSSDYSQIELRILAHIAKVDTLVKAFKEGMDIHTKTAMDIFKVDIDSVTEDMRRMAKAVNFGIIYGISSFGLAENLDIPMLESKEFIDNYLETYPKIKDYMDNIVKTAYDQGYVKTLLGRKRNIPELENKNYMIRQQGERIALNTPIQGTNADIIKKAMIEIHNFLKENNFQTKMILQVHDELVFDVYKDELEIIKTKVVEIMEKTYTLDVPLKVEVNVGENWYEV